MPFSPPLIVPLIQGATTNNRAVLRFGPIAQQLCEATTRITSRLRPVIHAVAIQYPAEAGGIARAPFVAGNRWFHLFRMLGSPIMEVVVRRLPQGHDPQPSDFSAVGEVAPKEPPPVPIPKAPVTVTGEPSATWSSTTQQLLAQLLNGARAIPIGAEEHSQFIQFHEKWSKGLSASRSE